MDGAARKEKQGIKSREKWLVENLKKFVKKLWKLYFTVKNEKSQITAKKG